MDAFAASHHGAISRGDARGIGASSRQIELRVASGQWIRVHDEVFVAASSPDTYLRTVMTACFAVGGNAFASHRTAAHRWGLPGGDIATIEITTRRWRRTHEVGFIVHESKLTDPHDLHCVDNIPVASPELTLMQLGAVCSPLVVEMAVDRALLKGLVTLGSIRELVARLGARGRNGVGVLRAIVADRVEGDAVPESPKETQLRRVLLTNGLPPPVAQFEVRHEGRFVARVDFAYPEARLALEYDSDEFHVSAVAHRRDAARRRAMLAIGWRVISMTKADLQSSGLALAIDVRRALAESPRFGV